MKKPALGFLFAPLTLLLFSNFAAAQSYRQHALIQPHLDLLPVGQSQSFQLLQADGSEGVPGDWALSDSDLAELKVEGNHVTVTAKRAGFVTLSNSSGAQSAVIQIHDGNRPMPPDSRWILQPIDGQFTHALWASATSDGPAGGSDPASEKAPSYYYEDRGPGGSHIRAVGQDGIQIWQWPASYGADTPRMISGDTVGGVLAQIGEKESRVLVDLDSDGRERWRSPAPGFTGRDFTYTSDGGFYFLEEEPSTAGGRIVGLDAHDGVRNFDFELLPSQETLRGLIVRDGQFICSPGEKSSTTLPFLHSHMMSNDEETANLAYSEFHLVAEAPNCTAGSVLAPKQVRIKVTQNLVMIDIHGGTASTSVVEENTESGSIENTWIRAAVPTGDLIRGEDGTGNFLAVRRTKQLWGGTGPGTVEEFQYRIRDDRTVKYRFPVPVSPSGAPTTMLLGENGAGYTTRGGVVIAFNTETGKETWRWESANPTVLGYAALQGDRLMVREGDKYAVLKDGQAVEHLADAFALFVMKLRPDWEDF